MNPPSDGRFVRIKTKSVEVIGWYDRGVAKYYQLGQQPDIWEPVLSWRELTSKEYKSI